MEFSKGFHIFIRQIVKLKLNTIYSFWIFGFGLLHYQISTIICPCSLTLLDAGGYQPPFCGGTNQFQISWPFPIWSLLSSGKVIFHFFCNFYKKITVYFFFSPWKRTIFSRKWSKTYFLHKYWHFYFKYVTSMLWEIFWGALHVCSSKFGMKFVPHPSHFWVSATSRQLLKRLCNLRGW